MKYRITVNFGPYRFTAECDSVAVAFHHLEALILSPMFCGTQEAKEKTCSDLLLILSEIARGHREYIENGFFRVDGIKGGRRS